MTDFLQTKFSGDLLSKLKNLWREETTNEEEKSLIKWQSRQEWLEKYEHEFNNEDLIKPRNETKRKNSSPRRQHNTNHNRGSQVRDKRNHTPARNQGSNSRTTAITRATSSKTRTHTTTTQNRQGKPPKQSSNRPPKHCRETNYTRTQTTRSSQQSNPHSDTSGDQHEQQKPENSAVNMPFTYSDAVRQSPLQQNLLPQVQQQLIYSYRKGPHFFGMSPYHLNIPPNHL